MKQPTASRISGLALLLLCDCNAESPSHVGAPTATGTPPVASESPSASTATPAPSLQASSSGLGTAIGTASAIPSNGVPSASDSVSGAVPSTSTEPSNAASSSGSASSSQSSAPSSSSADIPDAGTTPSASATGTVSNRPARVLLYSFSTLNIPSVPAQLTIFQEQLEDWGFEVVASKDPTVFTDENLESYAAVGMINTCFSPFGANSDGETEALVLQRFLEAGGGLFGTHCADVTFQSANPPALYNELLGGRASNQNFEGVNHCTKETEHPTTTALADTFDYTGNLDGTDFIADDSEVLVRCTWGNGTEVAVSWVRTEGAGRVFFTNFAKVDTDLTLPSLGPGHIMAGLEWVLGR